MEATEIKYFIEAALLAAGRPLTIDQLRALFDDNSVPDKSEIRDALSNLGADYESRGIMIGEVASGYRMQVRSSMGERLGKLWEERPPRYSRALFETLALIAYRQPMTRGEIEEIRGVTVSTNIIRTLQEREWVRVVGYRDVPGRPAMFGTTREFLDYFGLKKLDDLPPLADLSDWETLRVQLNLPAVDEDNVRDDIADIMPLPLASEFADDTDMAFEDDDFEERDVATNLTETASVTDDASLAFDEEVAAGTEREVTGNDEQESAADVENDTASGDESLDTDDPEQDTSGAVVRNG